LTLDDSSARVILPFDDLILAFFFRPTRSPPFLDRVCLSKGRGSIVAFSSPNTLLLFPQLCTTKWRLLLGCPDFNPELFLLSSPEPRLRSSSGRLISGHTEAHPPSFLRPSLLSNTLRFLPLSLEDLLSSCEFFPAKKMLDPHFPLAREMVYWDFLCPPFPVPEA